MRKSKHYITRKLHRYFGVFIGIQFFFWTLGGLYFSWNNMKDVHGKTLLDKTEHTFAFSYNKTILSALQNVQEPIKKVEAIVVNTDSILRITTEKTTQLLIINNDTSKVQERLSENQVVSFVKSRLKTPIEIKEIRYLEKEDISKTHEYRGKSLPVYVVELNHETNTKVYVQPYIAKITSVRNDNWRRFDFLWMLHVMDFETRDYITNWILRIFSVLGMITILSGFYLYYLSSPTIRKIKKRNQK